MRNFRKENKGTSNSFKNNSYNYNIFRRIDLKNLTIIRNVYNC